MLQETALKILQTGANVFLTGEPGSGKTHIINQYVRWLEERGISPAVTASTGIAATHIGGYTIHSWSGIGVKRDLDLYALDKITQNERVVRRVRNTCVLIIDEVSMLSATTLGMVDAVCREVRHKDAPFGGLQVVLVGDFFQLPPVNRPEDEKHSRRLEGVGVPTNASGFAFVSPVWDALNPLVCYLSEQHRQEDKSFLELLSGIRRGALSASHRALLEKRHVTAERAGITQLYSHNADVDRINDKELANISGDVHKFVMTSGGKSALVETLKRGCLSPETLSLKIGARVMFTKNDIERKFVNGTLGAIAGFEKETGYPVVKTNSGRTFFVEPMEWHVEDGGKVLARIEQIPLRLAWAITVHKSQGMSLDGAHMDLSQAFEYGQGYVALSRVRTLAGLSLAGLNERALEVHPEVAKRDRDFKLRSASARKAFEDMPKKEHDALKYNFVVACGGREPDMSVNESRVQRAKRVKGTSDSPKKYSLADIRQKHRNAYRPWSEEEDTDLRRRYLSGEKVKTLAESLGRQMGSISSRLVKLGLVQ
ncbi:MAG TPA: PIF1 family DEAD/DEAH box helicase [Candidatus Paceibacterota bacterium]|nr:PIF1 family DEAD/DEAH box helicase [Candidatus Paceibacterota bacterium]